MSEYEQFDKIFGGTWVHDRDEELQKFLDYTCCPEEDQNFVRTMKPTLTFQRDGNSIKQETVLISGVKINTCVKFGEEDESSDTSEPKKWSNRSLPTFDGTTYKRVVKSTLPAPRDKTYITLATVKGDELTFEMQTEDGSYLSKTFYKRK